MVRGAKSSETTLGEFGSAMGAGDGVVRESSHGGFATPEAGRDGRDLRGHRSYGSVLGSEGGPILKLNVTKTDIQSQSAAAGSRPKRPVRSQ